MNKTVGPHGLVSTLLTFGVMPKLRDISERDVRAQRERLRAACTARKEYDKFIAKSIVPRGLRTIPPPAADHTYVPRDFVYVYREVLKQYTGPHLVSSVED